MSASQMMNGLSSLTVCGVPRGVQEETSFLRGTEKLGRTSKSPPTENLLHGSRRSILMRRLFSQMGPLWISFPTANFDLVAISPGSKDFG